MIPKIIHQTWKNNEIPSEWKYYVEKVQQLNPNWEYKLWTDETMQKFVEEEFPDFLGTYIGFPKNVMRADSFRYLLMYKSGGVYLDLDYEMLKPFNFGRYSIVLPYNRQVKYGDRYDGFGNCFFASEPGQPFWFDVIEDLKNGKNSNLDKKQPYTTIEEETTGPAFLSRSFKQKEYSNTFCPDRLVYHPPTPRNEKDKSMIENNGISLGIHHCVGSWRDHSIKQRFLTMGKKALKRILY